MNIGFYHNILEVNQNQLVILSIAKTAIEEMNNNHPDEYFDSLDLLKSAIYKMTDKNIINNFIHHLESSTYHAYTIQDTLFYLAGTVRLSDANWLSLIKLAMNHPSRPMILENLINSINCPPEIKLFL